MPSVGNAVCQVLGMLCAKCWECCGQSVGNAVCHVLGMYVEGKLLKAVKSLCVDS